MTYSYTDIPWPSPHDVAAAAEAAGGEVIGTSGQGRAIHAISHGQGTRALYVVAGVHGAERINVAAATRLLRELAADPATHDSWAKNARLILIPLLNPDGYTLGRRGTVATWEQTVTAGLGDTSTEWGRSQPPAHYYRGPIVFDGVDYSDEPGFDIARDLPQSTQSLTPDGQPRWGFTPEARLLGEHLEQVHRDHPNVILLDLHAQRDGYTPINSQDPVRWSTIVTGGDDETRERAAAVIGGVAASLQHDSGITISHYPRYSGAPQNQIPAILSEVSGLPHEPLSFPIVEQIELSYQILVRSLEVSAGQRPPDANAYHALPATDRSQSEVPVIATSASGSLA